MLRTIAAYSDAINSWSENDVQRTIRLLDCLQTLPKESNSTKFPPTLTMYPRESLTFLCVPANISFTTRRFPLLEIARRQGAPSSEK